MPDLRALLTAAAPPPARPAPDEAALARRATTRARHRRLAAAASVLAVAAITAGAVALAAAGPGRDEAEVGAAPPVAGVLPPGAGTGPATAFSGLVGYRTKAGCYVLDPGGVAIPILWPAGTTGRPGGGLGVRLPDGTEVRPGQMLRGRARASGDTGLLPRFCRRLDGRVLAIASAVAGPPPRLVVADPTAGGETMQALVSGRVAYDGDSGCYLLQPATEGPRLPIVWPAGTRPAPDRAGVVLADGRAVLPGDRIRGSGGIVTPEAAGVTLPSACGGDVAVIGSVDEVTR